MTAGEEKPKQKSPQTFFGRLTSSPQRSTSPSLSPEVSPRTKLFAETENNSDKLKKTSSIEKQKIPRKISSETKNRNSFHKSDPEVKKILGKEEVPGILITGQKENPDETLDSLFENRTG